MPLRESFGWAGGGLGRGICFCGHTTPELEVRWSEGAWCCLRAASMDLLRECPAQLTLPPARPPAIPDCPQEKLPSAKEGGEPIPEGLLWLLMTGEVRPPTAAWLLCSPCRRTAAHASALIPSSTGRQYNLLACRTAPMARASLASLASQPTRLPPPTVPCLQMPTVDQAKAVTQMLNERSKVPDHVFKVRFA